MNMYIFCTANIFMRRVFHADEMHRLAVFFLKLMLEDRIKLSQLRTLTARHFSALWTWTICPSKYSVFFTSDVYLHFFYGHDRYQAPAPQNLRIYLSLRIFSNLIGWEHRLEQKKFAQQRKSFVAPGPENFLHACVSTNYN